ncbi:endoribonuclease CG2145 [Linepithema humile]|uniref:endoribonuclease CG2145 n=1 Tax=Linepithema humile TaxID=83485 RepID=UPI000623A482|nr:PREDICTED: poly(U)-specific endoribonuclease homolog [Linepithema humile]
MIVKNQFFTVLVITLLLLFIGNGEAGWKFWKKDQETTTMTTITSTSINIQPTATTTKATMIRGSTMPAVDTGTAVIGAANPGNGQNNVRLNRPNPGTEVGLDIAVPRPNTPRIGDRNDQSYRNWAIEFSGAGEPSKNQSPKLPAQGQAINNGDRAQPSNLPESRSTSIRPSIQPTQPSVADARLRNTPQSLFQSTNTDPTTAASVRVNQNKPDTPSAPNPGRTWAEIAATGSRPASPTDSPRQPEYPRYPVSGENERRTTHTRPSRPSQPSQPSQFSRTESPGAGVTVAGATTEAAGAANRVLDSHGKAYSSNPTYSKGNTVTDEDLEKLSEALYIKEANNPNRYITINLQKQTTSSSPTDEAPQPLLGVSSEALQIPTIQRVLSIFDNYQLDTRMNEYINPNQRQEESLLVDTFLSTNIMSAAMRFLADKGFVRKDYYEYKDTLRKIWFDLFSRGQGKIGSTGFEHVFMAETKQMDTNTEILGLHNWIYFNAEESRNHANYLGYIKKVDIGNKGSIIKMHAKFKGHDKPVTTMFIGTSPELEMALYTVCFHVRPDGNCPVSLGGTKFNIVTRKFKYRGKDLVGTAYPEI